MSKVKRGTAGELIVKAQSLLQGFNVFENTNEDSKIDLILEKDFLLYRIQVKIVNPQGQLPVRKLTHSKTRHKQHLYTKDEIDYFAGVDLKTFDIYMVPMSHAKSFTSVLTAWKLLPYKNNFDLQEPYNGNIISASPQIGETCGNGNTELASESWASVETLREIPKVSSNYGKDKVQTTNTKET